ncbi:MAG: hypothetical protein BWX48_01286 [Verrucomicrobia bacterium ADurb.Bin006]|nr:MAG: hypothetical protein BWX48_01286 [Verrucomicrobia bacterium ADurb.Bin006]
MIVLWSMLLENRTALKNKNVKLMKSKLVLLGLVFSLGSVTGLGQFGLKLRLSDKVTQGDSSYHLLEFVGSRSSDLERVVGGTFTVDIFRIEEGNPPALPTPFFDASYFGDTSTSAPCIQNTPFAGSFEVPNPVITEHFYGGPDSKLFVNIEKPDLPGITIPFHEGEQLLLTARINIPDNINKSGKWRLALYGDDKNVLTCYDDGYQTINFDNLGSGIGQIDYILSYNGDNLTLDVPEPSQFAVVGGLALLGFAGWRRSRN